MKPSVKSLSLSILGLCLGSSEAASTPPTKPNILFIMSDDHTAQAIGAYNGRFAALNPTPALDRLAREGMRLDRVFCNNSICTPSRASILTGQYSQANGVLDLTGSLATDHQYLPGLMHEAGYNTALIGKIHLGHVEPNFDYYMVLPGQGEYFDPKFFKKGVGAFEKQPIQIKGYATDIITDAALDWLKNRDRSKPFFFCLHHKAPHDDFDYAPRYENYLADVTFPEPGSLTNAGNHGSIATRGDQDELVRYIGASIGRRNVFRNQLPLAGLKNNTELDDGKILHESYQQYIRKYLRCVKGVDDNVQRVIDYLKQEGIFDNTLIIYTSDQGMWLGEHDYIDKRWMYEESMRMPMIVRFPGVVPTGTHSSALINNTDFAPTILDFAGVKAPAYMHGRSIRPILETGKTPDDWRKATYYRYWMHLAHHWNPAHFGIRTDRYKLIFFYGLKNDGTGIQTPPGWELYDLEKDPTEMNNLYDDPACKPVIADLKQQLLELRNQYDETDRKYPAIQAVIDRHWNTTDESRAEAVQISHQAKAAFELLSKKADRSGAKD